MVSYTLRLTYSVLAILFWVVIVNLFLLLSTDHMEAKIRTLSFMEHIKRVMNLDKG